jgi:peptidyl-tRNA hydrolase
MVMRSDLEMPAGKLSAQSGHVGQQFLIQLVRRPVPMSPATTEWVNGDLQTIISKRVSSEAALDKLEAAARAEGLDVHLVVDHGLTVFNGVHTKTGLSIGPHYEDDERILKVLKRIQNL